jgi:septum formation protein
VSERPSGSVPCPLFPVPSLVLASASPRRRELLGALGVTFSVQAADVPEILLPTVSAAEQAERLALEKAQTCLVSLDSRGEDTIVLGADTIVVLDGVPLGKPGNADEARAMLRGLRGRGHEVITGVAVACGDVERTARATTIVHMRAYKDAEIEAYIAIGDPFDKAGAYAIQHAGFAPVERIEGCYCNVMGLPLWTVRRLLAEVAPTLVTRPPSEQYQRCAACPERT